MKYQYKRWYRVMLSSSLFLIFTFAVYSATPTPPQRTVLAELFTATW